MLPSIADCRFDRNRLTTLPSEIGNCTKLAHLRLDQNLLKAPPAEIGSLTLLSTLDLGRNNLAAVPGELGNLCSITQVRFHQNNITSVPIELNNMSTLTNIVLDDHIADDPESKSVISKINARAIEITYYQTGRSATQLRLMKKRNAQAKKSAALPPNGAVAPTATEVWSLEAELAKFESPGSTPAEQPKKRRLKQDRQEEEVTTYSGNRATFVRLRS